MEIYFFGYIRDFEIHGEGNFLIFLSVQMPLVDVGRGPDEILWQRNDHEVNLLFSKLFCWKKIIVYSFFLRMNAALKGLSHEMDLVFDDIWLVLGQKIGRSHFSNFLGAPVIF
jgi:hypothetical protein